MKSLMPKISISVPAIGWHGKRTTKSVSSGWRANFSAAFP